MNDNAFTDDMISNNSANQAFADILQARVERRQVLKGGLAVAATSALAGTGIPFAANARPGLPSPQINFTPVAIADGGGPVPAIAPEYQFDIILPWGDPLEPGGPSYSWPPTAADQAQQLGIGHDGMWFFPVRDAGAARAGWNEAIERNPWRGRALAFGPVNSHGVLCLNHEFGGNGHVLGKAAPQSLDDVRASQHAHGVSVVELRRFPRAGSGQWQPVRSKPHGV